MIDIFCRQKHASEDTFCASCHELLNYAYLRLERCPFGEKKTACADCSVHCYQPIQRKEIANVMRYSGPKMVMRHPLLVLLHVMKPKQKFLSG